MAGLGGFFLAIAPTGVVAVALIVAGIAIDQVLAICGGVLAILTFAVSQVVSRRPRTRTVVFLAKSRSTFARNIFRGLHDGLAEYGDIHVSALFPGNDEPDVHRWQLECLASAKVAKADGLVIIPCESTPELWSELAAVTRNGTLAITVDTKAPHQMFTQVGINRPIFVGSDFCKGGRDIGRWLSSSVKSANARFVVALGPELSWPATERVSWLLYELGLAGLLNQCTCIHLKSWTARVEAQEIVSLLEELDENDDAPFYVFPGNDKVAESLIHLVRRRIPRGEDRVRIVGYDGTTTEEGSYLLADEALACATIDTLPYNQGQAAADYVLRAYEGLRIQVLTKIVEPRLVVFPREQEQKSLLDPPA